jgi:hypothetical protein
MRRLNGGYDTFFFEAVEVAWEKDLGVFDAEAEGRRGWWAGIGPGHNVGIEAMLCGLRRVVGDLIGDTEGVECHVVGAVADGVEA